MDFSADFFFNSALRPPLLFFILGIIASLVRSDLSIPKQISQFLSLYLLLSIGFRGGVELMEEGLSSQVVLLLSLALLASILIPIYLFPILRKRFNRETSAAVAACYGSVSVVTFLSAIAFLEAINLPYHGALITALAIMEFPSILVAFALVDSTKFSIRHFVKHLTQSSIILLVGSLIIGLISPPLHKAELYPLTNSLFMGFLCFFLLDMGMSAGHGLSHLKKYGLFSFLFSIIVPMVHGILGLFIGKAIGASQGDAFLFAILLASASYIAVPAAMRLSLPKADGGLYTTMALGMTFPFNLAFGIPFYFFVSKWLYH